MKPKRNVVRFSAFLAAVALLAPSSANAGWCTYCDESIGCWVRPSSGWTSCENVKDGCLLQGSCSGFASATFLADGSVASIVAVADQTNAAALGGLDQAAEWQESALYERRPCDDLIVMRQYGPEVAQDLRNSSKVISF
jgi:hypothetical protein